MAPINIRGNVLDPGNPQADVHLPPDASKTNYVLVQLKEGMTPSMVTALTDKGATIVKRMVDNTWLVNYPPNDLRALESIDGVDYALTYIDHFVVHAKLKQSSSETDQDECIVAVVLHEAASSSNQEVLHQIQSFCSPEVLVNIHGMLHLKVNQQDLEKIAALYSVQAIETVHPIVSYNDRTRDIIGVNAVNAVLKASNKNGLTGAGQVIAIADNGIDINHEALKDKVIARHSYRKEGVEDLSGHGTHVAGTVAGRTVKNWKGDDVMGIAPNAKLISLAMISPEKPNALPTTWYNDAIRML
jgi:subtilisin family serine protease